VRSVGDGFNAFASEFVRDVRYKLYRVRHCERVDQLFDLLHDRLEQHPIAPGAGNPEQEAARARLQRVFTQVRPGGQALPVFCNRR
jgi:hypothetical protein